MEACCPLCGSPIDGEELLVDMRAGIVSRRGLIVHLERRELQIVSLLNKLRPAVVPRERIYLSMYPGPDHYPNDHVVAVYIFRLRRKLVPLGIAIDTEGHHGYRMTLTEDSPEWLERLKKLDKVDG